MAGMQQTRIKLATAEQRVAELEAELARRAADDTNTKPKRSGDPVKLTARNRDTLIAQMLDAADEGTALPEIAARWNVTEPELQARGEGDVSFGRALQIARVRGKAAMWRTIRQRLSGGSALPASFVDRVMGAYEHAADAAGAEELIALAAAMPSDSVSCPQCGLTFEPYDDRPTQGESDGKRKG